MGRILYVKPARPGGALHWALVGTAMVAAVAVGIGLARLGDEAPAPAVPAPMVAPAATLPAVAATPSRAAPTAMAPEAALPATACPLQSLQLALDGAPTRTVCLDTTVLQQTGSVRTYALRAGDAQGWSLRVNTAERAILSVTLQARDGRVYACRGLQCTGQASLVEGPGAGAGQIVLRGLQLAVQASSSRAPQLSAGAGVAVVSARLAMPSDDQAPGLGCPGPGISVGNGSGAARRFCGQGGTSVEFTDNGHHVYRLQDHEGRTLTIAVDAQQRVAGVSWEGRSCEGARCSGAGTSSADPSDAMAERSFFFGRTALFDAGKATPAVVLDGTLVIPAQ